MKRSITFFFNLIPIWVENSLEFAVCLMAPMTNFSSWQITMPLYNSFEVFVPAKQYEHYSHSLDIKKIERNAPCALVYLWSHLQANSLFSSDSFQCTIIDHAFQTKMWCSSLVKFRANTENHLKKGCLFRLK